MTSERRVCCQSGLISVTNQEPNWSFGVPFNSSNELGGVSFRTFGHECESRGGDRARWRQDFRGRLESVKCSAALGCFLIPVWKGRAGCAPVQTDSLGVCHAANWGRTVSLRTHLLLDVFTVRENLAVRTTKVASLRSVPVSGRSRTTC